jgi:hypothetical protein
MDVKLFPLGELALQYSLFHVSWQVSKSLHFNIKCTLNFSLKPLFLYRDLHGAIRPDDEIGKPWENLGTSTQESTAPMVIRRIWTLDYGRLNVSKKLSLMVGG